MLGRLARSAARSPRRETPCTVAINLSRWKLVARPGRPAAAARTPKAAAAVGRPIVLKSQEILLRAMVDRYHLTRSVAGSRSSPADAAVASAPGAVVRWGVT